MADKEDKLSSINPTVENWFNYNQPLFKLLKDDHEDCELRFAPLVDVNQRAAAAGVSVEEYFKKIQQLVGPLGRATMRLVYSEMDNASHITIGLDN